jgi:hypothetical protein
LAFYYTNLNHSRFQPHTDLFPAKALRPEERQLVPNIQRFLPDLMTNSFPSPCKTTNGNKYTQNAQPFSLLNTRNSTACIHIATIHITLHSHSQAIRSSAAIITATIHINRTIILAAAQPSFTATIRRRTTIIHSHDSQQQPSLTDTIRSSTTIIHSHDSQQQPSLTATICSSTTIIHSHSNRHSQPRFAAAQPSLTATIRSSTTIPHSHDSQHSHHCGSNTTTTIIHSHDSQ